MVIERQVEIVPGNHIAGRTAGALVIVAHREAGRMTARAVAYRALTTLLGMARQASEQQPGNPGRLLARLAAEWASGAGAGTDFAILSRADGRLALFGRGAITAVLSGGASAPGQPQILRGDVDQVIRAPGEAAAIFIDDAKGRVPVIPPRRGIGSLVEGIMPASGAVVWLSGAAEVPGPTQLMPAVETAPAAQADTGPPAAAPAARLAHTMKAAVAPAAGSEGVRVSGFRCARRHLSDPRAAFCTVCGMPVDQTQELSEGVRPALGKLILDDGSVYPLDTDCVFGRAPAGSAAAQQGLRPVKLEDPYTGMSRAHVEFRLVGWDVMAQDLGSTNGTRMRAPGSAEWLALVPGVPVLLRSSGEVMLANRILRYETASLRI